MKSLQPYLLALVLMAMGAVFTGLGLYSKAARREMAEHGVNVTAHILEAKSDSDTQDHMRYLFRVGWEEDGARQEQWMKVTSDFFNQHVDQSGVKQPDLTLRTLPGRPSRAKIPGGSAVEFEGMEWLGIPLLLAGLFLFERGRRRLAAQSPAPASATP